MTRHHKGQAGEAHHNAKLTAEDVALARLIAADGSLPRPWITEFARQLGVSVPSLVMAIGGVTWKCVESPRPVRSHWRHRLTTKYRRPCCPRCGRQKYNRGTCRAAFHRIDHRTLTSAANAAKARAARADRLRRFA